MEHGDVVVNFDLDHDYVSFIHGLRHVLAEHPQREDFIRRYGVWLIDHPLLPEQRHPIGPARWIYINLTAQNQNTRGEVTLALRDDNVYLMGFKNRDGDWFEFGFEGKSARFLPGSTFLGCDVSYRALEGLVSLDLGKEAMTRAVLRLGAYQHEGPANTGTRKDLVRLCFMICEAARMVPHCQTVGGDGWIQGSRFKQDLVDYARKWSKMSRALLNCADSRRQHPSYDVVYLLLNSPPDLRKKGHQQLSTTAVEGGSSQQGSGSSEPQMSSSSGPTSSAGDSGGGTQQQQGQTGGKTVVHTRPLVQVFRVKVQSDVHSIRSVAVFDGKRGQIIYNNHGGGRLYEPFKVDELALIGPYKGISAEGSFAIQVCGITSWTDDSDESSNVLIGEMLWDCYTDNVKYDEILFGDIPIRTGTGQDTLATVAYAVWSDAVEATVEVNLLLPRISRVHGKITAHYYGSSYANGVVLFTRKLCEGELLPSAADFMVPLELRRSVIAVPVLSRYTRVAIRVKLQLPKDGGPYIYDMDGFICFYLDKHSGEIRIEQKADIFLPVGSTKSSDAVGGGATSSTSGQGTQKNIAQQVKVQVNMTSPGFHLSPLQPTMTWSPR